MTRSKLVTVGADIEVFVAKRVLKEVTKKERYLDEAHQEVRVRPVTRKRISNGDIIPCVGLFPGTKEKPHRPKGWPEGYAIQEDNVMLEFNIPPAKSPGDLIAIIENARSYVDALCEKKDLIPVWSKPEWNFRPIDLTTPQAKLFGCEPDLDAYSGGVQRDSIPNFGFNRTCGGHIHIGGDFNCPDFVAVLFVELVIAMYMGVHFVTDPKSMRSQWYGRPGVYREKSYGLEYRTLSNQWASNQYGVNDLAGIIFRIANVLVSNSAKTLQGWFRRIEWTQVQKVLMTPATKDKQKYHDQQVKWQEVRNQFSALQIPGLQL